MILGGFLRELLKTPKRISKKIVAHSSLTPSDLRLCIHRLNLIFQSSSFIKYFSVRNKRYRLRKKWTCHEDLLNTF
jgi:hypothetical protein